MSTLHIMRGLPASGKSTWAKAWVAEDPARRARLNRDTLREMLHDGVFIKGVTEPQIISVEHTAITVLLESGIDVVVDDTNLPNRVVSQLIGLAKASHAAWEVHDLTDVPVDTCIERDLLRYDGADNSAVVGEQVIRRMYRQYIQGRAFPLMYPEMDDKPPAPIERYVHKPGTPQAILVDVDGTMALLNGRNAYDESLVSKDRPNTPVIEAVTAAYQMGKKIIVMSGRTEGCRADTIRWLDDALGIWGVDYLGPFMRSVGDRRPDHVIKLELFDKHVRDHYNVRYVLDDRDQVVELWRRLGLTCMQVAPGRF